MTVLDSFFILFESDASKLDKGLAETEKKAQGLTSKLSEVDKAAGKMGNSLMQGIAQAAGALLATVSLGAMTAAILDAAGAADKLNESAERLGLNIETLSAWGDLVKKNGGSAEGFIASIEALNANLAQVEVTGKSRAAPFLKELGIDLDAAANKGKNAMDFLPQIAEAFEGMDKQKSVALGRRLGFDQATIMALQAGRREVEALIEKEKELGVITKKQGEIADAFGDQMDDTRHAFRSVWLGVSEYVLPPLTWMLKKFEEVAVWMRKHSDFIIGLMIALGAAILFYVLPPLISMGAAVVVAFAPFIGAGLLVAGLAAAFALLYDDIMAFIDGGDSMIGHIVGKWPIIGDIVKGIASYFQFLWDLLKAFFDFMTTAWDAPGGGLAAFAERASHAFDGFLAAVPLVKDAIAWLSGAFDKVASFFGRGGLAAAVRENAEGLTAGKAALAQASGTPLAAQTSASISNTRGGNTTSVQVGKVEVHTQATDAAGISKSIGDSMETQMRQAANNFDDGVLA